MISVYIHLVWLLFLVIYIISANLMFMVMTLCCLNIHKVIPIVTASQRERNWRKIKMLSFLIFNWPLKVLSSMLVLLNESEELSFTLPLCWSRGEPKHVKKKKARKCSNLTFKAWRSPQENVPPVFRGNPSSSTLPCWGSLCRER